MHDEFHFETNTVLCHFLKYLPCAVRIVVCNIMLHCLAAFLLCTVVLYYSKVKILAEIIWFCGVILTHVTTIVFLFQRHHPEDNGIIGL